MFNFIEKLEKKEREHLEKTLKEGTEVFSRTAYELINMVKSTKDRKKIASFLAGIFTDYEVGKTDTYNFKDLYNFMVKDTNYIEDHIESKMTMRLSSIQQQSYDNKNIRDQLDRSEKEKAQLREENEELKNARKFEERPEVEDGAEAKEHFNPWENLKIKPIILEGHDGENPLEGTELKEALDRVAEMILEDVKNLGKNHDDQYKNGGPVNYSGAGFKVKLMPSGRAGGKNFFKNLFNRNK